MANATLPRNTDSLGGAAQGAGFAYPLKAGAKVVQGCIVALDSTGYLVDGYSAGQASSLTVVGIAAESVDNTLGQNGDLACASLSGIFAMLNDGTHPVVEATLGTAVKVVDNQTISAASGSGSGAGLAIGFNPENNQVWVSFNKVLPV